MSLSDFLALLTGIACEILLLWEGAAARAKGERLPGFLSPRWGRTQELTGLVMLGGFSLVGLSRLVGLGGYAVYMGQAPIDVIFVGLGLFLLFYGMVDPRLLPRVNEQTVVVVNLVVLIGFFSTKSLPWPLLAGALVPSLFAFGLASHAGPTRPVLKAFVYLWYLFCLVVLAAQNNFQALLTPAAQNQNGPFEAFLAGAAGILLLLNSLFFLRFVLMVSSLILPRNRHYIPLAMAQLFNDEQMPRPKFLLAAGLAALVLLANAFAGLIPQVALLNLLVILAVHFLDRLPFLTTPRV